MYADRVIYLIFACLVLAVGMTGVVLSDFGILPAEGTVICIQKVTGLEFGYCKISLDVTSVIAAVILSLIFLHEVRGTREGTLISAILVGRLIGEPVEHFLHLQRKEEKVQQDIEEKVQEKVI